MRIAAESGTIAARMALLSDQEVSDRLGELEGWERDPTADGNAITKTFDRGDFVGSVELVRALVEPAEQMNHHPDLEISWSKVKVTITTHSEGGLTGNDFELAQRVEACASSTS